MQPQQYCLKWKYHDSNIKSTFASLRERANYCDIAIWCGGSVMRAHRAVLAASSSLFSELLAHHDSSLGEPSIVLTDVVHAKHLRHLLSFMYTGEVSVHHAELGSLLKTAEDLQIKGLADISLKDHVALSDYSSGGTTEISSTPPSPTDVQIISSSKTEDEELQEYTSNSKHVSGNLSLASLSSLQAIPMSSTEPTKRRRGRPPLEPKTSLIDNEVAIPDVPKRPNILRKQRLEEKKDRSYEIVPSSVWNVVDPEKKNNDADEVLSEYSEASLDGRDISHFLDTTMEEEPCDIVTKIHRKSLSTPNNSDILNSQGTDAFPDVIKLSDYLISGRRTQFWGEDFVKRVMEAIFSRELEMKQAAEILGVSYGTLYGRYRDTFGCINRPYRTRDFFAENAETLAKVQRRELTFTKAAELLNVTPQMIINYINSTANEPIIEDNDMAEAFVDALSEPNSKCDTKSNSDNEVEIISESEKETVGSYRLSDILRKHHEMQESSKELETAKTESSSSMSSGTENNKIEGQNGQNNSTSSEDNKKTENVGESSSTTADKSNVKKLPMIRVANLKFLKGETPGPVNIAELGDKNSPLVIKTTAPLRPDIQMMSSKRKVTFEEIEMSLKQSKVIPQ